MKDIWVRAIWKQLQVGSGRRSARWKGRWSIGYAWVAERLRKWKRYQGGGWSSWWLRCLSYGTEGVALALVGNGCPCHPHHRSSDDLQDAYQLGVDPCTNSKANWRHLWDGKAPKGPHEKTSWWWGRWRRQFGWAIDRDELQADWLATREAELWWERRQRRSRRGFGGILRQRRQQAVWAILSRGKRGPAWLTGEGKTRFVRLVVKKRYQLLFNQDVYFTGRG